MSNESKEILAAKKILTVLEVTEREAIDQANEAITEGALFRAEACLSYAMDIADETMNRTLMTYVDMGYQRLAEAAA